jgi:hypothetical protein
VLEGEFHRVLHGAVLRVRRWRSAEADGRAADARDILRRSIAGRWQSQSDSCRNHFTRSPA